MDSVICHENQKDGQLYVSIQIRECDIMEINKTLWFVVNNKTMYNYMY